MPPEAAEYGPFAPMVGYVGGIMAAGAAVFTLWAGRMRKWRPPDEDLPGTAQAVVLLLCGLAIVLQWYLAEPETIRIFVGVLICLGVATVVCLLKYTGLLVAHVYIKRVATSGRSTRDVRILGGRNLLPEAEARRQELEVDIQALLEGAGYKVDRLWSRDSRRWVKQRVLVYFILTLLSGTAALSGAGFATQVLLAGEPAAAVMGKNG